MGIYSPFFHATMPLLFYSVRFHRDIFMGNERNSPAIALDMSFICDSFIDVILVL